MNRTAIGLFNLPLMLAAANRALENDFDIHHVTLQFEPADVDEPHGILL